jgi:hypothetical protein
MGLYSGMIELCPQILDKGGSDRKWHYDTATITTVKGFIAQTPGWKSLSGTKHSSLLRKFVSYGHKSFTSWTLARENIEREMD